ncbi:NAD-dependent succinate-semialdehyde dehydrogenase [Sphingomonas glaciei]|uniref:NAD-dependent succinate-semialdehyde dehydrogenase n=1 Tax=Sphingomonas glaciei TaxID=2938948 RepID=A0ABY5MX48_9SPHN|nr:NAD-dependent succinate-semialdehyde dehydrogenase [Sphingomonas glaciei]UUR08381.1 NAD-dependent succinate-semialdehyde dehydrogenase [Sphingomonas glaciei]
MADEERAPVAQLINPATGGKGKCYPLTSLDEALKATERAHAVQRDWRKASFADRSAVVGKVAGLLRKRADDYAALMTEEMGKTLTDGRAEIEKCAAHCDWFAGHAEGYLADQPIDLDGAGEAFVAFNPFGVVLAVMPWNFPFWQVIRFAAPALMAGNGAVLKHASNVPGCALAIEQLLRDAGLPEGLFGSVLLPSGDIAKLIESPHIAAVTLTGSVGAGKSVAAAAGGVLKKCVLELGGSDAYLILDDADPAAAAKVAATARMVNGGQSCIAGKRFIVVESLKQKFEAALVEAMRGYAMGDPSEEGTKLGPMQSVAARDEVHEQVEASIAKGARLLLGGEVPDKAGAWYPATVLTDVAPGQPAHDEEIFGPVAAIITAKDEADAIRIANDSDFGLGSGVLTGDPDRGRRIARDELDAGMSFVNENVRSDPRMPFGGVKHSGYGRECADYGIREFVNIKTVLVKSQASTAGAKVE